MCLWILTACLGLLPGNPSPIVVVPGVPSPIIVPTAAPTTTNATAQPPPSPSPTPGNMTMPSSMPPTMPSMMTTASTMMTMPPMTMPTATTVTNAPPTMTPTATTTMPSNPPPTSMTTVQPTIGGILIPLVICANPDSVCIFNPNESTAGPLPIDPRLGTTLAPSAAINMPPITGYSVQVLPSYDTAVKFPRSRRSVDRKYVINLKDILSQAQPVGKHNIVKRQSCACVTSGTCIRNTGAGMIDVRIVSPVQCPTGQEYCCGNTTTAATIACGKTQTVPATAITPSVGQANFGEFPWQAMILTKQNDYIAGGVLIDSLNVLTVTHRLMSYVVSGTAPNVKVRLGEWDAAGTYEPVPFQEYTVAKVFSHPMYNANTLQYDITVIRLASAVPFTPSTGAAVTINRACLPPAASASYVGQRCMVSGWGKDMFGQQGQYQQILKKVDVPVVAAATCQTQLQTARLGATYVLDTTSFICAGGEANKDSCSGDGGSGLVCQVNGQWVVIGLVSWGLGCANSNVPGVYVNVAGFLPWIQQQIAAV